MVQLDRISWFPWRPVITKLQHRSVVGLAEHFHLEDSRMGENFSPRGPQIHSLDSEIIGVPNFDTHLMPLEFIIDAQRRSQLSQRRQFSEMMCFVSARNSECFEILKR